ncbi:MAG TPA: 2-C-methyl-D-erythritol 4-phosphate cytidylyltransferase [Candidatus Binatia bacterium]|nr:2-C-methyl-D-erythritol 4-phosphate cytidylyltransferase [Candidatus Binatia bacterium]
MTSAVIVAAGRGTRMGPDIDKLFLQVAGRPVVAHTWLRFDGVAEIGEIILVVREGMESAFKEMGKELRPKKPWRAVIGGKERQDSVWNGLQALAKETEVVAIQDGARPCTSEALICETLDWARQTGAAVAAQRVTDTIKESEDGNVIARNVDRSKLWSVQTPQAFRVNVIKRAIEAARERGLHLTDDTAACELIGQAVRLVEGKEPNPKVTLPTDIPYIEMLLRAH